MDEVGPEFDPILLLDSEGGQYRRDCFKNNLVRLGIMEAFLFGKNFTDDGLDFMRFHRESRYFFLIGGGMTACVSVAICAALSLDPADDPSQ